MAKHHSKAEHRVSEELFCFGRREQPVLPEVVDIAVKNPVYTIPYLRQFTCLKGCIRVSYLLASPLLDAGTDPSKDASPS
ncbi:hypothetical protein Tco_0012637 [Tanacetum coccineum]